MPVVVDYLVGPLPVGPRTDPQRSIIMKISLLMLVALVISLFLAREVAPIAHVKEVSMHFSVNYLLGLLSPQKLLAALSEVTRMIPSRLVSLGYDGSFTCLWMTWRRNTAGSFILPVSL